jgi:hypothetical protein
MLDEYPKFVSNGPEVEIEQESPPLLACELHVDAFPCGVWEKALQKVKVGDHAERKGAVPTARHRN